MSFRRGTNILLDGEIEEPPHLRIRSSIELFFQAERRLQLARFLRSMYAQTEDQMTATANGDSEKTLDITMIEKDDAQTWPELVDNDTVDYLGRRADKSTTGGWITAPLIFGAELCERMAAFGIIFNLVTFLVGDLHLSSPYSANMVTNMLGTSFITCLLGGYIADSWLGRFLTISIFAVVQFLGLLLITLFATLPQFRLPRCDTPDVPCRAIDGFRLAVLYMALYLIALGTGGIKACVSAFGADQFDATDRREKKQMMSFFNWFFFSISLGALFAVTVLVYVQDKLGRGWGFGITSSFMLVAFAAFISGRHYYRYSPFTGSPLTQITRVFVTAFRNHKLLLPDDPSDLHELPADRNGAYRRIAHTDQFLCLSKAAIKTSGDGEIHKDEDLQRLANGQQHISGADSPKYVPVAAITVTEVEEVKVLVRVLPILATTFLFWTVYAQMVTFSIVQALTMDRRMFGKHFEIPPASVGVFLQLSIMLTVVLYDRAFLRVARRVTQRPDGGISTLQRIGVGLALSIAAMVAAALVEQKRRQTAHRDGSSKHMTVFWLVPQYFLVGAGEAFTYVGQLEFFYSESPPNVRSMGTAICLCTLSFGFYFSSIFVDCVDRFTKSFKSKGWLGQPPDSGHLDFFYWLLAVVSVINFFLYLVVAKWYKYNKPTMQQEAQEEDAFQPKEPHSPQLL